MILDFLIPKAYAQLPSVIDTLRALGSYGWLGVMGEVIRFPVFQGQINCSGTACSYANIFIAVYNIASPLIPAAAFLMIVLAGLGMLLTQDENIASTAKKMVGASIAGIVMYFLVPPFVEAFYGGLASPAGSRWFNAAPGIFIISDEVNGFINWILSVVAVVAIVLIIVNGLGALLQSSSEEGLTKFRKTLYYAAGGIMLILLRFVISATFGYTTPTAAPNPNVMIAIGVAVNIVNFALTFLALVALGIFIYGGIVMIVSLGSEERFGQAKSLIYRAIVGFIIILVSLALVNLVVTAVAA